MTGLSKVKLQLLPDYNRVQIDEMVAIALQSTVKMPKRTC